jgi:hypothetical protein
MGLADAGIGGSIGFGLVTATGLLFELMELMRKFRVGLRTMPDGALRTTAA